MLVWESPGEPGTLAADTGLLPFRSLDAQGQGVSRVGSIQDPPFLILHATGLLGPFWPCSWSTAQHPQVTVGNPGVNTETEPGATEGQPLLTVQHTQSCCDCLAQLPRAHLLDLDGELTFARVGLPLVSSLPLANVLCPRPSRIRNPL